MTVKELRALISKYKAHHNIKGYHDMKKSKLVAELHKRFEIKEGKMYLKTDAGSVVVADEIVVKRPKSAMEKARKPRAMLEEDVVEPEIIVKRPQSLAKARQRRALLEGDEPVAVVKEKRRIVPTLISSAVAPPVAVVKEKRRIVPTLISSPAVAPVREKRKVVPTLISSPAPVAVRKKSKKKKKYASPGLKTWEKATNKLYEKYKHASEDMHPDLALSVKSKKKGKKKK